MTLVSQTEFAAMHGVTPQAVFKWNKRGWMVFEGKKVNVEKSNKLVAKYRLSATNKIVESIRNSQETDKNPVEAEEEVVDSIIADFGVDSSFEEAKRVKEIYQALLNQLKYDTESGLVIMAEDVVKEVGEEYAKVRTRLMAIPAEQAPRIHRLKTVTEVQDALQEMIFEALEELTKDAI